jgi:hypothetical protein
MGWSVAFDSWGNVAITGEFYGNVDFGGGLINGAGGGDAFLAKFNKTGSHLWSQGFGSVSSQSGESVAFDSWGNIDLVGEFRGTVDFGGDTLTSAGSRDIYLVKFDSSGTHLWSQRFGDGSNQFVRGSAIDPWGNVVMTGLFEDTVDFGGGPLISTGSYDIYLVKFGMQVGVEEEGKDNEKFKMHNVKLYQNLPNPFHNSTTIHYELASSLPVIARNEAIPVSLTIYDITGRLVATLVNENQKPGIYQVQWDGSPNRVRSGIYFYRLSSGDFTATKKLILLR